MNEPHPLFFSMLISVFYLIVCMVCQSFVDLGKRPADSDEDTLTRFVFRPIRWIFWLIAAIAALPLNTIKLIGKVEHAVAVTYPETYFSVIRALFPGK